MHSKETDGSIIASGSKEIVGYPGCEGIFKGDSPKVDPGPGFGIGWGESQEATVGESKPEIPQDALSHQVGGNHYKDFAIQPVEFITRNKLSFLAGCIVKRICRYNRSGGKGLQDLEKIKHEVDLLIELEEWGLNQKNIFETWRKVT